jgi:glycosyltransferase involved in cell wall biosynthesis/FtsH-binding integral membrane protein
MADRVRVDGKFFRLGKEKFPLKGVTYGPFAPNSDGEMFASREQTARDFDIIKQLNANVLRVYYVPPGWLLDLAAERGLKVVIDVPWQKHLCFLDSRQTREGARRDVRQAVEATRGHPAVFAYSVVNEISAEIVRWSGVRQIEDFINDLVAEAKAIEPDCLCTFSSFPPTEFLQPQAIDFVSFNVYLHHPRALTGYLDRLQTLAGEKPLVLGEFGMDSFREGESGQSEFLNWQIELAWRAGVAGTIVFSFTDDWFRGGMQIEDWGFGLTSRDRKPKQSFVKVQRQYGVAPRFPSPEQPRVTVVVASYNGQRTLQNCLQSLTRLNYSNYEVVLVDDGSTDRTPEIARLFPSVRHIRQANQGLAAARNTGIRAATGEIVAFTDDDCRADEDWLYYLVNDLVRSDFAAIGGHNFLPPEDSSVAAAVVVSPGGPAHVMLSDREAEHIPGCNMAFYKWALEEIGLFDPIFKKAGDDVDVCWRLLDSHRKIGFSPAGFVWHYRRSTMKAYLKQQAGYGEAEALLMAKHPERYNSFGGGVWRGRIYAPGYAGLLLRGSVIYHGVFASGFFQRLYAPDPVQPLLLCTSLGYHVFVSLPLLVLALYFDSMVLMAITSLAISFAACSVAAAQARLAAEKQKFWSRPLICLLFLLQPLVRGWARFKWRILAGQRKQSFRLKTEGTRGEECPETSVYWSDGSIDRFQFLKRIVAKLDEEGWSAKTDSGWTSYDIEIFTPIWSRLKLLTVSEELENGKRTFRCRIRGSWSLPARLLFLAIVAAAVVVVMAMAKENPWTWFSVVAIPLAAWIIDDEQADYQQALARIVDGVAGEQKLKHLT